jgi:hypothetical protein
LRAGENPTVWRGHLDATLPKPGKLTRGHHAALAYVDMPAFMAGRLPGVDTPYEPMRSLADIAQRDGRTLAA